MSEFKLKHFSERNIVCESVEESFLIENGMDKDYQVDEKEFLAVPTKFSIKDSMSPVRDQGGAGTCTSFGVLSNLEYKHGRRDLSESCITHDLEKKYGDCKEGAAIVHAYLIARDKGVVDESVWPYDDNKICWNPVPNTSGQQRFKFSKVDRLFYRRTKDVIENMRAEFAGDEEELLAIPTNFVKIMKSALHRYKKPLTISVPVWFKWDGHFDAGWDWAAGGVIQMPTPVNLQLWMEKNGVDLSKGATIDEEIKGPPNVSGWHAISICGYDDSTGRFTFKNSWGSWWGQSGYGTMPYNYITRYSRDGFIGI